MRGSALLLLFALACSGGATIEGDVYDVSGQGQPARAAGSFVALVTPPDTSDMRLCVWYYEQSGNVIARQSELMAQMSTPWVSDPRYPRFRALEDSLRQLADEARSRFSWRQQKAIVDTQTTRIDAHFEFRGVRPGEYLLLARAPNRDGEWRRVVSVRRGQRLAADLGPAALFSDDKKLCEVQQESTGS